MFVPTGLWFFFYRVSTDILFLRDRLCLAYHGDFAFDVTDLVATTIE
jgi:hypothetical protein